MAGPPRLAFVVVTTSVRVALVRGIAVFLIATPLAACTGHRSAPATATTYPAAYAIRYRDLVNGVSHIEVLEVHRPFDGFDLSYTFGEPTYAMAPSGGWVSTPTALYDVTRTGTRLVGGRQPGPPSGDEYVGAELGELVMRHLAVDLQVSRRIAGQRCSLYRFASPPSGPVAPVRLKAADHDDLCIDAAGLVVGETWTYHGKVVESRTATLVALGQNAIAHANLPSPPSTAHAKPAATVAPSVTPIDVPLLPIAPPPVPAGFRVALPAQEFRLPNPDDPASLAARSVVWSFGDAGDQLITVEVGSEAGGRLPWASGDTVTRPVSLPLLGTATSALRSDGAEIRVVLPSGAWLRVRGTVPIGTLIAYARQLRLR
ncbi:MAG TPA: hypothetical protein VG650_04160 [Mycobacteriales bacterium]|nr:hypothetical protein [Mycobacteriales bacterium]